MTERETILNILNRIPLKIYCEDDEYIEFENGYGYDNIIIEFNVNGYITNIGC